MNKITELKKLLEDEVLLEVQSNIKELTQLKQNKQTQEELLYMQNVEKYFNEVLLDIENSTLMQQDAIDILESLEEMKIENEEI